MRCALDEERAVSLEAPVAAVAVSYVGREREGEGGRKRERERCKRGKGEVGGVGIMKARYETEKSGKLQKKNLQRREEERCYHLLFTCNK